MTIIPHVLRKIKKPLPPMKPSDFKDGQSWTNAPTKAAAGILLKEE